MLSDLAKFKDGQVRLTLAGKEGIVFQCPVKVAVVYSAYGWVDIIPAGGGAMSRDGGKSWEPSFFGTMRLSGVYLVENQPALEGQEERVEIALPGSRIELLTRGDSGVIEMPKVKNLRSAA